MLRVSMETRPAQGRQRVSCWAQDVWDGDTLLCQFTMRLLTKLVLTSYTQSTHAQMHQLEASRGICFWDSVRIYWLLVSDRRQTDRVFNTLGFVFWLFFFFHFFSWDVSLFTVVAVGEGGRRCSLLGPTKYWLCSVVLLASEQNHISSCSALLQGGLARVVSRVPIIRC